MYAVIETGGKQYRVAVGDVLRVEKIAADAGATVSLDKVLMVANGEDVRVGNPVVTGTAVNATVRGHGRSDKTRIFKLRRRKHYRKQAGHRQYYTELEITGITGAAQ
ncbi:MAG: 50S ribosomal protein L21 [Gammaproteobacteria bacterium]|nr:50S ribosomal protein L21 [Gammaproteobacteria bacterium]